MPAEINANDVNNNENNNANNENNANNHDNNAVELLAPLPPRRGVGRAEVAVALPVVQQPDQAAEAPRVVVLDELPAEMDEKIREAKAHRDRRCAEILEHTWCEIFVRMALIALAWYVFVQTLTYRDDLKDSVDSFELTRWCTCPPQSCKKYVCRRKSGNKKGGRTCSGHNGHKRVGSSCLVTDMKDCQRVVNKTYGGDEVCSQWFADAETYDSLVVLAIPLGAAPIAYLFILCWRRRTIHPCAAAFTVVYFLLMLVTIIIALAFSGDPRALWRVGFLIGLFFLHLYNLRWLPACHAEMRVSRLKTEKQRRQRREQFLREIYARRA